MMSDVQHLVLFKPDFRDKNNLKGTLVFKCPYRAILGVDIDNKNRKKLSIEIEKSAFKGQIDTIRSSSLSAMQSNVSVGISVNVMASIHRKST